MSLHLFINTVFQYISKDDIFFRIKEKKIKTLLPKYRCGAADQSTTRTDSFMFLGVQRNLFQPLKDNHPGWETSNMRNAGWQSSPGRGCKKSSFSSQVSTCRAAIKTFTPLSQNTRDASWHVCSLYVWDAHCLARCTQHWDLLHVLQYCVAPPGHGHQMQPIWSSTKISPHLQIVPTREVQDAFIYIIQQRMLKKNSANPVPLRTFVFSQRGDSGAELYF